MATQANDRHVRKIMREFKRGTLKTADGTRVTDRDQALAIALREQRRADKRSRKPRKPKSPKRRK